IDEEGTQAELGRLHGRAGVVFDLAQEQEVTADLILGQGDWITAEMFGALAHVTDVLLFGGRPEVFEVDKLLELCDGGIGSMSHRRARMPSSEDKIVRHLCNSPMTTRPPDLSRRAAAQFNHALEAARVSAFSSALAVDVLLSR